MNPVTLYILAYLADMGETWTEAPESDPDHGFLYLTNEVGERLTFGRHLNGGDPQWFVYTMPKRWEGTPVLDGLHPLRSPPKRTA